MKHYSAAKVRKEVPIADVCRRLGIELKDPVRLKIPCPLHKDTNPSFSIREFPHNDFKCFGCDESGSSIDLVMGVLHMGLDDACNWIGAGTNLDPEFSTGDDRPAGSHGAEPPGDAPFPEGSTDTPPDPVQEKEPVPKPPQGYVKPLYGGDGETQLPLCHPWERLGHPEGIEDYRDWPSGELLYQSIRWPGKIFKQRQPDDKGGWIGNITSPLVKRVPARLPELMKSDPKKTVFVVEGEKDCNRLAYFFGIIATCNSGGAKAWKEELNHWLEGRRVIIIPDNDEAGEGWAEGIAKGLKDIAEFVGILRLENLPAGGDVSNYLDGAGTITELRRLDAECEPYQEPEKESVEGELSKADYAGMFYGAYDLLKGMQASPEAIGFCFPGANGEKLDDTAPLLPGTLNVIMGRPGHGKTTFMVNAALNMAAAYPDNAFIYLTFEETPAHLAHKMLRPLSALNAFLDTPDSNIGFPRLRTICNDLDDLSYDGFVELLRGDSPLSCPPNVWKAWAEFHRLTSSVDGRGPQIILLDGHAFTRGHSISLETITSIVGFHRDSPDLKPIGAIFFDYAQKIPWQPRDKSRAKAMSRQQELADISEMLLRSAKDNNIPLVAGAQVNREVKAHKQSKGNGVQSVPDGAALTLDKLREAGDFEQDAFLVIGLWHGELAACEMARGDERISPAGNCELLVKVLKNRGGEVGNYDFCFNVTTGLITGDLVSEVGSGNEGAIQEALCDEGF